MVKLPKVKGWEEKAGICKEKGWKKIELCYCCDMWQKEIDR